MSAELEQRVVAALSDESATADALAEMVAALEAAINEADAAAEGAKTSFLDPIESPDANKARAVMEATQFVASRLRSLLPRIQDRYREVAGAEDLTRWRTDYESLKTTRDALAAELGTTYPTAVAAIVDVLARIADYDRRASALHQSRPAGGKGRLFGPELVARGLDSFTRDTPSVTRELRLPDWQDSVRCAWPPPSVPASVLLAESMPTSDPRYSADWREALKADTAKRIAEEERRIESEAAAQAESKREYEASLPR